MRRFPSYSLALLVGSSPFGLFIASCSDSGETSNPGGAGAPVGVSGASSGGASSAPLGGSGSSLAGAPVNASGAAGKLGGGAGSAGTGSGGALANGGAGGATAGMGAGFGKAGSGGAVGAGGQAGAAPGGAPNGGSASAGAAGSSAGSGGGEGNELLAKFSFFVTSMKAIQTLSGNEKGFGGDLRFGKADGLAGADEICRQAAELGMPGAGNKQWRAFLSVAGPPAVNARDRIGKGPWYDAQGRLVAQNLTDLFAAERPKGDAAVVNDLPNERGEPNHFVGTNGYTPGTQYDNHDTLTGSDASGNVYGSKSATCQDWTSKEAGGGRPRLGHSWPRRATTGMGAGWASDHEAPGCEPGINISTQMGQGTCVGCSGGYGGIYCFELKE